MKYRNHHRPDDAHDCSVKLAIQEQNARNGIMQAIPDPDAPFGFRFEGLHPDFYSPHASRDAEAPQS